MSGMPMPGGWSMSMVWMRVPGQSWPAAAASFVAMWTVMMVPMMLPSLVPALRHYGAAVVAGDRRWRRYLSVVFVASTYFLVWAACGAAVYLPGSLVTSVAMRQPAFARVLPLVAGVVVLVAGAIQFTKWKAQQLACCRATARPQVSGSSAPAAWHHGLTLGIRCGCCCANLMAVLLMLGVMDLRVMALVTAAITVERFAPMSDRPARAIGVVLAAAGVVLIARSTAGM